MESVIEIKDDRKKEWLAPELDEIDVREITASQFTTPSNDATTFFS